jgi:hypothetical protein
MQSVSLNKSLSFPRSAWSRRYPYLFIASLMAVGLFLWARPCPAQGTQTAQTVPETKEKFDLGLGGFYQVTGASNGNFIRVDTTESGGALFSFRQPYRPWVGYEANLGFTRFSEAYNKDIVKVADNGLRGSAISDPGWGNHRLLPHGPDHRSERCDATPFLVAIAAGVRLGRGAQLPDSQSLGGASTTPRIEVQDA